MVWSRDSLKQLVEDKLRDYLFIVVSNREPYIHKFGPEGPYCIVPASGLTLALDPVLRACGGTWIAHGSGEADRAVVDENNRVMVPPEDPQYSLRRIWLNKIEETGYYYGLSNEALWPLCHIVYIKPKFIESDWQQYKKVNALFAKTILEEVGNRKAFVFLQDYHLSLVPEMLRQANPEIKSAVFWHIPWPNPEAFRICPWKEEILRGMLGADLLAFHINYHVDNFLTTVDRTLEVRVDKVASSVVASGRETLVKPFPISIDYERIALDSESPATEAAAAKLKRELNIRDQLIGIGTDRIDYTKGIPERLKALDIFFEDYPEYLGKFTFIQAGVLSRIHIPEYKKINDEINSLVEAINFKYATDAWRPIIMVRRHFSQAELIALYRMADIALVTSLHDGMNLVAKEYVAAARANKGVLVLSRFTGSARELTDALLINPYSPKEIAAAIKLGLTMPAEEKNRRLQKMKELIAENNIYKWAGKILQALLRLP